MSWCAVSEYTKRISCDECSLVQPRIEASECECIWKWKQKRKYGDTHQQAGRGTRECAEIVRLEVLCTLAEPHRSDMRCRIDAICAVYLKTRHSQLILKRSSRTDHVLMYFDMKNNKKIDFTDQESFYWKKDAEFISSKYYNSKAVDIGEPAVMLHVSLFEGIEEEMDGSKRKSFALQDTTFPYQLAVDSIPAQDNRFTEQPAPPIDDLFPIGQDVVYVGQDVVIRGSPLLQFGSKAMVLAHESSGTR